MIKKSKLLSLQSKPPFPPPQLRAHSLLIFQISPLRNCFPMQGMWQVLGQKSSHSQNTSRTDKPHAGIYNRMLQGQQPHPRSCNCCLIEQSKKAPRGSRVCAAPKVLRKTEVAILFGGFPNTVPQKHLRDIRGIPV